MMISAFGMMLPSMVAGDLWDRGDYRSSKGIWSISIKIQRRLEANSWLSTKITWFCARIIGLFLLASTSPRTNLGQRLTICLLIPIYGKMFRWVRFGEEPESKEILSHPMSLNGKAKFDVPFAQSGLKDLAWSVLCVGVNTTKSASSSISTNRIELLIARSAESRNPHMWRVSRIWISKSYWSKVRESFPILITTNDGLTDFRSPASRIIASLTLKSRSFRVSIGAAMSFSTFTTIM